MKRITVSLDDDLMAPLDQFKFESAVPPPAVAVVVAALREFLTSHGTLLPDEEVDLPVAAGRSDDPHRSHGCDRMVVDVERTEG